ncbi:hypothetical protein Cni_G11147 [Canna indica]|uniref:Citrulline--aspartate ligase n=1 Tax=Canna indica TaxID=4628 RepID=A0AAQ3QAY9_9LILI|nr:hypothetical protein Cni_G11147 [Canna indica]
MSQLQAVGASPSSNVACHGNKNVVASSTGEDGHSKLTDVLGVKKGGGLRGKLNKVVLAYSGGLDTSVIVPWLRENYGCEVVCFTADVGQGDLEMDGLEQKAKASGASQLVVKDLKEEFVRDYIFPCLRAGAVYERKYLLGTSMARPVIAKAMVDVAKEVGADAVAHGCTGKGNDQVRFELTFFALNPELQVVVPWREWEITGREDAVEYAKKHNIPVPVSKKSIYSRDRNLWHLSHEGDILEDPGNEPKKDMYMMSVDPEDAPDQPEYLEIGIEAGIPVSINGRKLSPASLLSELNNIGGKHGIGRIDMVENRLVGMKSRGVYETPGGTILWVAARELESLTLDRETIQVKDTLALKYAELVYAGRWFDPLRCSMDAFMEKITETTTGSVMLKLYKGSVTVASRKSPYSLYREDISSFENGNIYNQADAAGFIRLYGLPTRLFKFCLEVKPWYEAWLDKPRRLASSRKLGRVAEASNHATYHVGLAMGNGMFRYPAPVEVELPRGIPQLSMASAEEDNSKRSSVKSVAVVGGGVSGLAAAYKLKSNGLNVTLFEAEERTGGKIKSSLEDGLIWDEGANTMTESEKEVGRLIDTLGLREKLQVPMAQSKRYIVKNGGPQLIPLNPVSLITSNILSAQSKAKMLLEPFLLNKTRTKQSSEVSDENLQESVGQFFRRHFGEEVVDYLIDPFVAGTSGGDPESLSIWLTLCWSHLVKERQ